MNLLITGATGFVGRALCQQLASNTNYSTTAALRQKGSIFPPVIKTIPIGDITSTTNWQSVLTNIDVVIHLAARVHIMEDTTSDPLAAFRQMNVDATLNLARQAAGSGVKRFIFLSSIKVNGEQTFDQPFRPDDQMIPTDPYGLSKYEAEQALLRLAKETGMEVIIIRPPLVYGAGVKANFQSLINLLHKPIPLPFGAIHNQRSMIALDNLVDFIIHCIEHPKAANEVFLVSDGQDVSTTELMRKLRLAMGMRPMLLPVPASWMRFSLNLLGKQAVAERLFGSLQVDSSKAHDLLGWVPPISLEEGLRRAVISA